MMCRPLELDNFLSSIKTNILVPKRTQTTHLPTATAKTTTSTPPKQPTNSTTTNPPNLTMSSYTTNNIISTSTRTVVASPFHTTLSMENMPHRTITLTCTDNDEDTPLNPDGTLPTPAQKALDILTNTTTRAVINWETNAWELLTTRHAPFGKNWWRAVDSSAIENRWIAAVSSAVEEALKESARQARESNEIDLQIAEIITEAEVVIERSRQNFERMQLDVQIEESMAEAEFTIESLRRNVGREVQLPALRVEQAQVSELDNQIEESMTEAEATIENLRHNVGIEVQLHALGVQQAQVSEQIERGEQRIRRQARDSGVDWCEL